MKRKLICVLCFIVVINSLSVVNGISGSTGKRSPSRRKSNEDEDEKINDIVAVSLNSQFKDKQFMLPVSPTHYNLAIAWRGLRRFISKKVLKIVSPGILREARIGKLLNALMYENHVLKHRKNTRPTHPIPEKKPNIYNTDDDDSEEDNSKPKRPSRSLPKNFDDLF